jgi:hypothetical protein
MRVSKEYDVCVSATQDNARNVSPEVASSDTFGSTKKIKAVAKPGKY